MSSCRNRAITPADHTQWADSIVEKAYDIMSADSPSRAITYLDSMFRVMQDRGVGDRWRKYNGIANCYRNFENNPDRQNLYLDSMFDILKGREEEYRFEYAHTLFAKAQALQAQSQYSRAFQFYYDARSFAAGDLDYFTLADFDHALGNIRYQQGQYLKAVPYLATAFQETISRVQTGSFYYSFILPQALLNSIGVCYERAGLEDSAIFYYHQALECIADRGKKFPERETFISTARGVVEGNMGETYARMGRYAEAEKSLKADIDTNDRPGYAIEDAQTSKLKLADLYVTVGRLRPADSILQHLWADLESGKGKSIDNDEVRRNWYRLKWHLAEKENRTAEAFTNLKNYDALNDSITQVSRGLRDADLDLAFKDREQQFQLALLQKKDQIKSVYLAAVIIFLVMFIVLVVVVWSHLSRTKRDLQMLTLLNSQLNHTLTALNHSREENSNMMKIAAHDLRNPLGAMMAAAGLMLADPDRPPKDRTMLQMIKVSGENSLALVTDLLEVNTKVQEPEKKLVDVRKLLHDCVGVLQHKAAAKQQQIELKGSPVSLRLSPEKMWRVINNLVGNAIKFSPAGSPIHITLQELQQEVVISIRDRGIGIPPEIKDKLFEMFTPARRKGTAGEESFGLGLAISKQIVEAHGGKIWFESSGDVGTTFFIAFPKNTQM